jgi:phosphoribosylformylglycinamidine synthase
MKFTAEINIMPLKALLDPQGKAVSQSMEKIGFQSIGNVRVGKHITLEVEAGSKEEAGKLVEEACKKILANPVMEGYDYKVEKT